MLRNIFKSNVYVKVYKNKFVVKDVDNNYEIVRSAFDHFTTTRLLVGHFNNAETLLKEMLKNLHKEKWFTPSPVILVQPMEMIEKGLSPVENRVLKELAIGAGGRKVTVWVGNELSNQEVIDKIINA